MCTLVRLEVLRYNLTGYTVGVTRELRVSATLTLEQQLPGVTLVLINDSLPKRYRMALNTHNICRLRRTMSFFKVSVIKKHHKQ